MRASVLRPELPVATSHHLHNLDLVTIPIINHLRSVGAAEQRQRPRRNTRHFTQKLERTLPCLAVVDDARSRLAGRDHTLLRPRGIGTTEEIAPIGGRTMLV